MSATFLLTKDIQKELENFFANKSFPAPNETNSKEFSTPNIVIGHLPPKSKDSQKKDDPPFIIVRLLEGGQKQNESGVNVREVEVQVICCVYSGEKSSETEAGYNYLSNIIDSILQVLVSKQLWCDDFFTIRKEINWKTGLPKEQGIYEAGMQEHPFYYAVVSAKFEAKGLEFPRLGDIVDKQEKL
jgi:hypothetical protein